MATVPKTSDELTTRFTERMIGGLVDNNVLRGSWAEELVAWYLGVAELPRQWSYFDLVWNGSMVSVKHSVGAKARFLVGPTRMAWDWELVGTKASGAGDKRPRDGWRGHEQGKPQHWCDLYVFAHLPAPLTQERVLDPAGWQFAALGRPAMHVAFGGGNGRSKSASIKALTKAGAEFRPGAELPSHAAAALATQHQDVPPVDMRTREEILSGKAS